MRKVIRFTGLALVGVGALLVPLVADAACGTEISFGAYYTKVTGTTNTASLRSSFWAMNGGNPALGAGADNGNVNETGTWLVPYGAGFAIFSGWAAQGGYDGCIDAVGDPTIQRMAIAFSDVDGTGAPTYAAGCVHREPSAGQQFAWDLPAGCGPGTCINMALVPAPKGNITGTVRTGTEAQITVGPPNFAPGYYTDGSVGCEINTVITGYDVYKQQIVRNTAPNSTRDAGPSWVLVGSGTAGNSFTFTTTCGTGDCDVFVAVAPKYNGGFTTSEPATGGVARVGANSNKIQAGSSLAITPKAKPIPNRKIGE